jgi:PadR family transcriptional regulator PadR
MDRNAERSRTEIDAEWALTETNRRARFYRLTAAGRVRLTAEVSEFNRVMGAISRVIRPVEG